MSVVGGDTDILGGGNYTDRIQGSLNASRWLRGRITGPELGDLGARWWKARKKARAINNNNEATETAMTSSSSSNNNNSNRNSNDHVTKVNSGSNNSNGSKNKKSNMTSNISDPSQRSSPYTVVGVHGVSDDMVVDSLRAMMQPVVDGALPMFRDTKVNLTRNVESWLEQGRVLARELTTTLEYPNAYVQNNHRTTRKSRRLRWEWQHNQKDDNDDEDDDTKQQQQQQQQQLEQENGSRDDPTGRSKRHLTRWPSWLPHLQDNTHSDALLVSSENRYDKSSASASVSGSDKRNNNMYSKNNRPSISDPNTSVSVVTTACLPWMTGTAVNPLLRVAFLSKLLNKKITLVVPWISELDQQQLFPNGIRFGSPAEQELYVRNWLENRVGASFNNSASIYASNPNSSTDNGTPVHKLSPWQNNINIVFYPGKYSKEKGSIFAVGDVTEFIPTNNNKTSSGPDEANSVNDQALVVLEEPEHLSWYHHGQRWSKKFQNVVGIVHTNYLDYVRREELGTIKQVVLKTVNEWVVRAQGVHKVIKLSDAVQNFPRSETCFVHGVSPVFIEVGKKISILASAATGSPITSPSNYVLTDAPAMSSPVPHSVSSMESNTQPFFSKECYFIGKVLWGKGYTELVDLMTLFSRRRGVHVNVDVFGHGPDFDEVKNEAQRRSLALKFHGAKDHSDKSIHDYKVFINPSTSDVVATTTAEALAMGKFVICARHPSNEFFAQFPNCLIYRTPDEFLSCLDRALRETPAPLRDVDIKRLSWEDATRRFIEVTDSPPPNPGKQLIAVENAVDNAMFHTYNSLIGWEPIRRVAGAGPNTAERLDRIEDVKLIKDAELNFLQKRIKDRKASSGSGKAGDGVIFSPESIIRANAEKQSRRNREIKRLLLKAWRRTRAYSEKKLNDAFNEINGKA